MDIVNIKLALEQLETIVPEIKMDEIREMVRLSVIDYHESKTDDKINSDLAVVGIVPRDEMELKPF
tara:strand:- start:194 stop:391 length:198 start_codon:yes stop_codon:yes gene_type:complete